MPVLPDGNHAWLVCEPELALALGAVLFDKPPTPEQLLTSILVGRPDKPDIFQMHWPIVPDDLADRNTRKEAA